MADVMAGYLVQYEDLPAKNNNKIIRKDTKMSKKQEIPTAKTRKAYSKTRGEHYKDILIAVLITGIICFVAGLQFANSNNEAIKAAVEAVTPAAEALK